MERQAQGWKWVFRPGMITLGAFLGLGVLVLLQQSSVTTFSTGKLIVALVLGAILGIILGSAGSRRQAAPQKAAATAPEAMK